MGLALVLLGAVEALGDVAADVQGEPGEVVAGVLEPDVGGDEPVHPGQHPVGARPVDQFAVRAQHCLGDLSVGAGLLRAVDVQQPA